MLIFQSLKGGILYYGVFTTERYYYYYDGEYTTRACG